MEPRPLQRFAVPSYPTKLEVQGSPGLLQKAQPASWRRDEVLVALAAAALLSQSACAERSPPAVAPVSRHGDGVVSVGCVVISPPVFLSEEEAREIIVDEAARRGLSLSQPTGPVLGSVLVPAARSGPSGKWWNPFHDPREEYVPDLYDPGKHVAVELVSKRDARRFANYGLRSPLQIDSTAYVLDMRHGAVNLTLHVRKKGASGAYFGAVYEPAASPTRFADSEQGRAQDEELLRAQVKDFLDWLQAQGAL